MMKQTFLILIALLMAGSAYADCSSKGIWVFPNGETIKQNSIFVIEGYSFSQRIILDLNKKYPVYLKSGNKKVKLIVSEICVGQFHLTQAILKPETELEAGLEYTLCIDSLASREYFNKHNKSVYKDEPVIYKVTPGRDSEKPQLLSQPKELKKTLIHFGCGPSIHVIFDNPAKDQSELIVKTTVKNLQTGKETSYYILPEKTDLKVGHNMCDGAFDFKDGDNYEIEFSFMDASGNVTAWTGERLKFTRPAKETTGE